MNEHKPKLIVENPVKSTEVANRWDDAVAAKLNPVDQLIYRSNILGDDLRVVNTGGGNTSAKIMERDPLTGKQVNVLWVKGSGGDLRTAKRELFASLYQDKVISLNELYQAAPKKGVKTQIEDDMVGMYPHCTFNLNPRAASIDTPLHAFVPFTHVDHTHPNSVIAIAAAHNGEQLTKEIYGDDCAWMAWQRPGYDLGLKIAAVIKANPKIKGIVMGQHGLISWANDGKACYLNSLDLINRAARFIAGRDNEEKTFGGVKYQSLESAKRKQMLAELMPWLRGMVSAQSRKIGTVHDDDAILRFINSVEAQRLAEIGTSCPDHFLRTKIKPFYVPWNPQKESMADLRRAIQLGFDKYRVDYAAYYERCKRPDSPAMRDANPSVILIPGLGMISWGKNKSESRVTSEFYNCAIDVMRGAEAVGKYIALPEQEAFDIEYWLLEEAKLKRMPPEKPFSRQVVAVIGAGSGIGKELASRLSQEGAHVICVDLNADAASNTAKELSAQRGNGIGVAGTGISNCGPVIGLGADITKRDSVAAMLAESALAYGGIDGLAITAGYFPTPDESGRIPDEKWAVTFAINVTGHFIVADEANKLFKAQNLPGKLVITTSANAVVAKKGSFAYDTSKAASNHLVRELAVEMAPLVRVNGVAPATVIAGSSMFPRDRVISSLAKYSIPHSQVETTESLIAKLAKFYADRTLTKLPVTVADQAEAIFLLLGDSLPKTTGQIIPVDGGLHEAFLR
jgi:rhamnulose-1-phosphate aldolase/alcohol dehydrogenase